MGNKYAFLEKQYIGRLHQDMYPVLMALSVWVHTCMKGSRQYAGFILVVALDHWYIYCVIISDPV